MTVGELINELQKDVMSGKYNLEDPICYSTKSNCKELKEVISVSSTTEYVQELEPGRELSVYKYYPQDAQKKVIVRIS